MQPECDFHLHYLRSKHSYDIDFYQAAPNSPETETILLEGRRFTLGGDDKLAIKEIRNFLLELRKEEISELDLKAKLLESGAEQISFTLISSVDKLARQIATEILEPLQKQIASEILEPLQLSAKNSLEWLINQYEECISLIKPVIPPSLPELSILEALKDSQHANCRYALNKGSLYLTDGKTGLVKVIFSAENDCDINSRPLIELLDPKNITQQSENSLLEAVKNLMVTGLKAQEKKFQNNYFFKSYSEGYGIPVARFKNILFIPGAVSYLLEKSDSIPVLQDLCQGVIHEHRFGRELIAELLRTQEEEILAQFPPEVCYEPMVLREHLIGLLAEKGLSYEEAVLQFDKQHNASQESVIEGGYVVAKLIAQIDAWKALRDKAELKGEYKHFPFLDIWRFFIDGSREEKGPYIYENEPFYMLSSLRGFTYILDSSEAKGKEAYESYAHALTCNPPVMKMWQGITEAHSYPHQRVFFNAKACIAGQKFDHTKLVRQDAIGIADLEERSTSCQNAAKLEKTAEGSSDTKNYWMANALGFYYSPYYLSAHVGTGHEIVFQRIFLGLEQMLRGATTPGERLIAYIWAARELEITHQMEDGNGRTSITSLIKWIAEDPELPFYLPEDPNILDLQSPETIIRDVHSGMRRFQSLCGGEPDNLIDVDLLIEQAGVKGASWNVVHERAELPEKAIEQLVAEDKMRSKIQ